MITDDEKRRIATEVIDIAKTCFDPEIPVNIWEMGLIYKIVIDNVGQIFVDMTLTSPNCPAIKSLPRDFELKLKRISGVLDAKVRITFDPPYTPELMSEAARLTLNL